MKGALLSLLLSLFSTVSVADESGFVCDMRALTKGERAEHARLGRRLIESIQERHELPDGYAFRLAADRWSMVARWAELERKCCPFFAFQLEAAAERGPLWLRITGRTGVKTFMKEELGL